MNRKHEIVFAEELGPPSDERRPKAIDNRPALRLGFSCELVALDQVLAEPDEVAPCPRERPCQCERDDTVFEDSKPRSKARDAGHADQVAIE